MGGPASTRFYWLLCLVALAGCTAWAAAVLAGADVDSVRALDGIAAEHEHWHIRPITAESLHKLQTGLLLLAAGLGLTAAWVAGASAGRREVARFWGELRLIRGQTARQWQRLPQRAQLSALAAMGLLTLLRVYFSLTKPEHAEEIASYEYFVREGLLAVGAYYPIPNNHPLSNAISCGFYQVHAGFWWSMRLPVLLISTAGTVGLFAGALHRAGFRAALLGTACFCWLQLSLYNASAGRGYWLLITLAGTVFFSALALAGPTRSARTAWAGLVVGSLAGCYTIPSFAYVLASALAGLGLRAVWRRDWSGVGQLAGMGSAIAAGLVALYAPVLFVSGAERLFGNGFVEAQPWSVFWKGFPAYWWFTEGLLAGQRTLGALAVLTALPASAYWLLPGRPGRAGALAAATNRRRLTGALLWFVLFPYALVMSQRVFSPERVLLYKSFFFFVLVGLLADRWHRKNRPAGRRRGAWALLAGLTLFAGYQTYYVERLNRQNRTTVAAYRAGFDWLRRQPAGAVLVPEPLHELYFRFWTHTAAPPRPWQLDMVRRPARRYAYVVAFPNKRGAFQPEFSYPPAFANAQVEIFAVQSPRPTRNPLLMPARQQGNASHN